MTDLPEFLLRKEAAARLRVSTDTIRRWCVTGRLDERPLSSHTKLVTRESVERLLRTGHRTTGGTVA